MSPIKSILKSSIFVGALTILVKAAGLAKQTVIAYSYGSSVLTDSYFIAEGFIRPLAVLIFSSITISFIAEYIYETSESKKMKLVTNMLFLYVLIASVLIIIILLFKDQLTGILARGLDVDGKKYVSKFIIVLLPIIFLYSISSLYSGLLESRKIFIPGKLEGLIVSLSIISGGLIFSKKIGILSLAYSTLTGYLFYALFIVFFQRNLLLDMPSIFSDGRIIRIIKSSVPLMIGNAIVDVSLLIDRIIASSCEEGSVSFLYYGQVVSNDLIASIFITSVCSVFYPFLIEYVSHGDTENLRNSIIKMLRLLCFILLPITMLYVVLSNEFVGLILGRGEFVSSVNIVSKISAIYALGFVFLGFREILVKLHYAYRNTKDPMINGIISTIINVFVSYLLSKKIGVLGIAVGTTVSYFAASILCLVSINKHINFLELLKEILPDIVKAIISVLIPGVLLFYLKAKNIINNIVIWTACVLISIVIYCLIAYVLKNSTAIEGLDIVKKRILIKMYNNVNEKQN